MRPPHKSLLLAGLQLLLVASLGGKLLVDRATRPRFWLKAAPVDPDMPIRGRYVDLRVELPIRGALPQKYSGMMLKEPPGAQWVQVKIQHADGRIWAECIKPDEALKFRKGQFLYGRIPEAKRGIPPVVILDDALPYFIPEHVPDPSRRKAGEELWVEVTMPRKGPLRPIRLAVKDGTRFTLL